MARHASKQQQVGRKLIDYGAVLFGGILLTLVVYTLAGILKHQSDILHDASGISPMVLWDMAKAEAADFKRQPLTCLLLAGGLFLATELCALITRRTGRPNPLIGAQIVRRESDRYYFGGIPRAGLARTLLIILTYLAHRIVFVYKTCIELAGEPRADWATLWRFSNPFILFGDYTADAGMLLDIGVKACLLMAAILVVLYLLRSDAFPWALGRIFVAAAQVAIACALSYGLATFLSKFSHGTGIGTGLRTVNLLGFIITALPLWMALLFGIIVIGSIMGGIVGDDYGKPDGYYGKFIVESDPAESCDTWQTGQLVHDTEGHTGMVRREGEFIYIDRDDGTQDVIYDALPGSAFTSSNGHHYVG